MRVAALQPTQMRCCPWHQRSWFVSCPRGKAGGEGAGEQRRRSNNQEGRGGRKAGRRSGRQRHEGGGSAAHSNEVLPAAPKELVCELSKR